MPTSILDVARVNRRFLFLVTKFLFLLCWLYIGKVNRNRPYLYHSFLYAYVMFSLIFLFSVKCCVLIYSIMEDEVIKEFQLF